MTRPAVLAALFASLAGGCAWGDGDYFAELSPRIESELEVPAGRDVGSGWQKLESGFEVSIERFDLEVHHAVLFSAAGGGEEEEGHGHDHGAAGEEESGSAAEAVLAIPVGELDVLAGASRDLACDGACGLPRAEIEAAVLEVEAVRLGGLVRDGRDPPRLAGELPWSFQVEESVAVSAPLELRIDRDSAPELSLTLRFHPTVGLLDDVAFGSLAQGDQEIDLAAGAEVRRAILERLGETTLEAEVGR